jgi:hypothetical protein
MNQRNREQLRAAIVDNLNQGKQTHSPTRDLLKQYRPLKGILTPALENAHRETVTSNAWNLTKPVEKSMASDATVAQQEVSPWHAATVAPPATLAQGTAVESYTEVKGELRVPNTINFGLFPTLDPFAKAVYYQLYLLAYGFRRETCTIGLAKLAKSVLMSQRKVQDTVSFLEKRKLIQRVGANLGGSLKGNIYRVFLPNTMASDATTAEATTAEATTAEATTATRPATLASNTTNKDDDDLQIQSSSKRDFNKCRVEKSCAPAFKRRPEQSTELQSQTTHLNQTREMYHRVTGNKWTEADGSSYCQNRIADIPIDKVISTIETISHRAAVKVNSFNYFVKEILAVSNPRTRMFEKKQLERVARRVRDNHVGSTRYSASDFVEDVKRACSREGVRFDADLLSELSP